MESMFKKQSPGVYVTDGKVTGNRYTVVCRGREDWAVEIDDLGTIDHGRTLQDAGEIIRHHESCFEVRWLCPYTHSCATIGATDYGWASEDAAAFHIQERHHNFARHPRRSVQAKP